jgi:hypothetical protein
MQKYRDTTNLVVKGHEGWCLCQDLVGELPRNFFYNSSGTILTIFLSM